MGANGRKTQFPDEVVAHVRAMTLLGYPADRTARDLPLHFPDEDRLPSTRTVQDWAHELRETAVEEVADEEIRIARRMGPIVHSYIDKIESGEIKPSFSQIMLGWGLPTDKVRASRQQQKTPTQVNILALIQEKADSVKAADGTVGPVGEKPYPPRLGEVMEADEDEETDGEADTPHSPAPAS